MSSILANDNLSGPSLATFLIKYLEKVKKPKYHIDLFLSQKQLELLLIYKNLELMKEELKQVYFDLRWR